jgi:ABC-type multidrug transport system ATPase subunit
MFIRLQTLGKRYNRHWVFRKLDAELRAGQAVAITGPNGSGKSTLLQVIAGALQPSEGTMIWTVDQGEELPAENHFKSVSVCAPYLELIEELTLAEFLRFHEKFKAWLPGISVEKAIELTGLQEAKNKQIRDFSSGMKQRVKLAQAILSNSKVLLLDEPTSNLDQKGIDMYHQWMQEFATGRLVVIASNDETEIGFCQQRIHITDHKN